MTCCMCYFDIRLVAIEFVLDFDNGNLTFESWQMFFCAWTKHTYWINLCLVTWLINVKFNFGHWIGCNWSSFTHDPLTNVIKKMEFIKNFNQEENQKIGWNLFWLPIIYLTAIYCNAMPYGDCKGGQQHPRFLLLFMALCLHYSVI